MLRGSLARHVIPVGSRGFRTTAVCALDIPKLEPISLREYRIAAKMKQRFQPPAHREFMDLMAAMARAWRRPWCLSLGFLLLISRASSPADRDFDVDHPDVVAARKAIELASEDAESKRKGQKASTNYHLSRHLRR